MKSHSHALATSHPGLLLRDVVLPQFQLSVTQAARDLGITRQTLHRILAGKAAISTDMAVRLGQFCGLGPQFWLDRQQRYDLERALVHTRALLPRIPSRRLPERVVEEMRRHHAH